MNKKFKPFRLINNLELDKLRQDFRNKLEIWNEQFALFPFSLSLNCSQNVDVINNGSLFIADNQMIALFPSQNLAALSHCLFGDLTDCFNNFSETMLIQLLKQLFDISSLQPQPLQVEGSFLYDEWFYTGSPSLAITLHSAMHSLIVYIHPEWVLRAIPENKRSGRPKGDLQQVLGSQLLDCQVELNPVMLPLDELFRLKPGDVIKTDHTLNTPLLLKHKQHTVCQVEPGETNQSKSIQIARAL